MKNAIQTKNDAFRKAVMTAPQPDGKAVRTQGVAGLGSLANMVLQAKVAAFDDFNEGNDPYGEHDFGSITLANLPKVFWKIDYYENASMEYGTEDKLNCYRVLIIMLAEEY